MYGLRNSIVSASPGDVAVSTCLTSVKKAAMSNKKKRSKATEMIMGVLFDF